MPPMPPPPMPARPRPSARLEVCVEHSAGARSAILAGAPRLELCASLADGGLTPSAGLLAHVLSLAATSAGGGVAVHVLVRPRAGGFVYGPDELDVMVQDVEAVRRAGAAGVVVGALTSEGEVDLPALQRLVLAATGEGEVVKGEVKGRERGAVREGAGAGAGAGEVGSVHCPPCRVVFHRAFDLVLDRENALEVLVRAGVSGVLTSGGKRTLWDGRDEVKRLVQQARGRIEIIGGAGVNKENAAELSRYTGVHMLHASLRRPWPEARLAQVGGGDGQATMGGRDAEEIYTVSEEDVKAVLACLG